MRKLRPLNRNRSGFTLIELLMAILLIAILALIGITQFTNYSKEAKNVTTKENLGILRNAIQKHFGTMRVRCNVLGATVDQYPSWNALNENDITADGNAATCTTADVEQVSDRYFVAGGIPENPWSDKGCLPEQRRTVQPYPDPAGTNEMEIGQEISNGGGLIQLVGGLNCGWLYHENTGRIKANSENNSRYPSAENLYESAY